jgi:hypothetical protein
LQPVDPKLAALLQPLNATLTSKAAAIKAKLGKGGGLTCAPYPAAGGGGGVAAANVPYTNYKNGGSAIGQDAW